ncbi:MAG: hypothetical protein AAGJ93_11870 [Bacteroidota bacterium]
MNLKITLQKNDLVVNLFTFLFLLIFSNCLCAQQVDYKNNSVYVSYGTVIFSDQFSVAYEHTLFAKDNLRTRLKGAYGTYLSNNADYDTNEELYDRHISLSAVQLIGLFEFNLGVAYIDYTLAPGFDPTPDVDYSEVKNKWALYGNVGIRYVKNNFLLRAGISRVELLYLGLGINF